MGIDRVFGETTSPKPKVYWKLGFTSWDLKQQVIIQPVWYKIFCFDQSKAEGFARKEKLLYIALNRQFGKAAGIGRTKVQWVTMANQWWYSNGIVYNLNSWIVEDIQMNCMTDVFIYRPVIMAQN